MFEFFIRDWNCLDDIWKNICFSALVDSEKESIKQKLPQLITVSLSIELGDKRSIRWKIKLRRQRNTIFDKINCRIDKTFYEALKIDFLILNCNSCNLTFLGLKTKKNWSTLMRSSWFLHSKTTLLGSTRIKMKSILLLNCVAQWLRHWFSVLICSTFSNSLRSLNHWATQLGNTDFRLVLLDPNRVLLACRNHWRLTTVSPINL